MELKPEEIPGAYKDCIAYQLSNKSITVESDASFSESFKKAFDEIPHKKYIEQASYLKNYMLPKIEKSRGLDSAEYKFYYSVFESLMYACALLDRDYSLRYRLGTSKIELEFYRTKVGFYETELQRYTTMEDLHAKELANLLITQKTNS